MKLSNRRADYKTAKDELLKLMKKAGFRKLMSVAPESGSDRVLKLMKKV